MTVREKLIACAIAAVFILLVLAAYAYLVVTGKAEAAPFLALLTSLVMAAVGLVSGLAGHAAASGATPATAVGPLVQSEILRQGAAVVTPLVPVPQAAAAQAGAAQ